MSRQFSGSGQYLEYGSAIVTAPPFTVALWFRPTSAAATYNLFTIDDNGGSGYFNLYANPTGSAARIAPAVSGVPEGLATTSTSYTANTWNHACGVWATTGSRAGYLNGGGKGTSVDVLANPTGLVQTNVGGFHAGGSVFGALNGRVADVGVWNVAFTDAEVALLASGLATPLDVRRSALLAYWPLIGADLADRSGGGRTMVATGATVADGPPVAMPFARQSRLILPGPAPTPGVFLSGRHRGASAGVFLSGRR